MEDLGSKIYLIDIQAGMEELNFAVKGLESKVTCLEEERV